MESKEHVFIRKSPVSTTLEELWAENAQLRQKLSETDETIQAIRNGSVDAFVVGHGPNQRIYSLESADRAFRLFVESMRQGVAMLHADGNIAYCNQRLAEQLNVPAAKLMGMNFDLFVSDSAMPAYKDLFLTTSSGEVSLKQADHTPIPVLLTFNRMPAASGDDLGLLVTDLTSEKVHQDLAAAQDALRQIEKQLRSQTSQFEVFSATAAIGLHTIGPDGTILWANDAQLDLLGFSREQYIGHHLVEFHADKNIVAAMLSRTHRGEKLQNLEVGMKCLDGSIKTVLIDSGAFWVDGEFTNTLCFIRDITARKEMDAERRRIGETLRESESLLGTFLQQLPVGVAAVDLEGRITISNAAMSSFAQPALPSMDPEKISRWRAYDFRGQPVSPQDWPGVRALRGETVTPGLQMTYTTDAGTHIWTRVSAAPLCNHSGKIIGAVIVVQDIDSVKRAQSGAV